LAAAMAKVREDWLCIVEFLLMHVFYRDEGRTSRQAIASMETSRAAF
jgi:hypothetical protein